MVVGNPSVSPASPTHDAEQFSFLSEISSIDDTSLLYYSECVDENALNLPPTRVSFTPTRVKPQPRAWERKPSTPFAPRSDTQKIWKRVPLQTVTSSINASWRRGNNRGDGIMRPVKRQRIGGQVDIENKGNAEYIGVKWDTNESPDSSPHRRAPINRQASGQAFKSLSPQENKIPPNTPDTVVPSDLMKSPNAVVDVVESIADGDEEGTSRLDSEVLRQSPPGVSARLDGHAAAEQLLGEADVFLRMSPESSPIHSSLVDSTLIFSPFDSDPFDPNTRMSPVLPVSRVPLKDIDQSMLSEPEPGRQPPTEEEQVAAPSHNDQDDTSYLQDFLLRSRAQKAAKSQLPAASNTEERQPVSQNDIEVDTGDSRPLAESTLETEYATSVSEPPADEASPELSSPPKASSPQRRSNRLTRLPRPQKLSTTLPNSIALRRLNGSEFISLQREAQSLAATTRGNTRKNKGMAVGVQPRLVELKSELPASASGNGEDDVGGEESAEAAVDISVDVQGKRTGKRKSVIWAEVLAVFQEYHGPESITSSPDAHSNSQDPTHLEQAPPHITENQNEATPSPELQAMASEPNQHTSKTEPKENTNINTTEGSQKRTAKRVRKLRKESVGSVNGTPAPKRSIEILLRDAAAAGGTGVDGLGVGEAGVGEKGLSKAVEKGIEKEIEKEIEKGPEKRSGSETSWGKRTRSKSKH